MFAYVVSQIAAREKVHCEVEVVAVLKRVIHVDDERIVNLREDLSFVHDRLDAFLGEDSRLGHLFHSIMLFRFLPLYFPHFAETAPPNAVLVGEVVLY